MFLKKSQVHQNIFNGWLVVQFTHGLLYNLKSVNLIEGFIRKNNNKHEILCILLINVYLKNVLKNVWD